MNHNITAGWDTLMKQSKDTAWDYFGEAHKILEGSELKYTAADVIALAKLMTDDFRTASMGVAAQKISGSLDGIGMALDGVSTAIGGVECSLDAIAEFLAERSV